MNEEPSATQMRSLYLQALGIPFAGVYIPAGYLHDGCETHGSIAANDEPTDGRA